MPIRRGFGRECLAVEAQGARIERLILAMAFPFEPMSMPRVSVESLGGAVYRVVVTQGRSTTHEVTVTPEHLARYAPGSTPERLLEASFEFLLEREPPSSILSRFALPVIERYFPEYPRVIAQTV